jgi:hypothetical protein
VPYIRNKHVLPLGQDTTSNESGTGENLEGKWIGRGARAVNSLRNYLTARNLMFKVLEDGKMSVSAPSIPTGRRIPFRQSYDFDGTRYNPGSITRITGRRLLRGALSRTTWGIAFATSLFGNAYDFALGKNKGKSFQEFAVSTGVDTVMTVGTGLAAAALVVGVAGFFGATLTVGPVILLASFVGVGIGLILDSLGVGDWVKTHVNSAVDHIEDGLHSFADKAREIPNTLRGINENARIIRDVVSDRVRETISNTTEAIRRESTEAIRNVNNGFKAGVKTIKETAQYIGEETKNIINKAVNGAKEILGSIFGGG